MAYNLKSQKRENNTNSSKNKQNKRNSDKTRSFSDQRKRGLTKARFKQTYAAIKAIEQQEGNKEHWDSRKWFNRFDGYAARFYDMHHGGKTIHYMEIPDTLDWRIFSATFGHGKVLLLVTSDNISFSIYEVKINFDFIDLTMLQEYTIRLNNLKYHTSYRVTQIKGNDYNYTKLDKPAVGINSLRKSLESGGIGTSNRLKAYGITPKSIMQEIKRKDARIEGVLDNE